MTEDEIRKLLGGYATNALTADERRILFEAALDDQELFNALQNEDALRELLDDPVSRDQVRRALEQPKRPGFWSRRWALGVAIPAVAAVIVIAVMNRATAPEHLAPPRAASAEIASTKEAAPLEALQQPSLPRPAPPQTAPPARVRKQSADPQSTANLIAPTVAAPVAKAQLALAPPPLPDDVRQQFSSGFVADAKLYQGPLVQYSLVRSGPAGDEVRVEVSTRIAGYLALYRVDAGGNSSRVYPETDAAIRVVPDISIQIPPSPLKIADAGEKLRLVILPAAPSVVAGQNARAISGAVNGASQQAITDQFKAEPAPLVIDIPIGSK
jgi:hypothetical protein